MQNAEKRLPQEFTSAGRGGGGWLGVEGLCLLPALGLPCEIQGRRGRLLETAQARGLAGCTARQALRREMKPKLRELLRGAEGPALLALATVASCGGACALHPPGLGTDLCAKPSAAATGSTFRAGNARPVARRGRRGQGARQQRRCGGPGSRAPTADAAAARSLGHPCRAPAPARRRLQQAARPGPGGGSECRRSAGGAQEAASGVTGGTGSGAGQHTGGLGFSAGGRAPSRRPPCRSMVCGGKQKRLVTRGFLSPGGPRPSRHQPTSCAPTGEASRPDSGAGSARRTPYCTRLRSGSLEPPCTRVREHTRTVRATLGLQEPEATRPRCAQLPFLVPESPCGEGAVAKRLLAPLGDKNPNLRSHHAHSHARAHTHIHTHPLPSPAAQRCLGGKSPGSTLPPTHTLVFLRSSFYCIPLNRITMLIKRVILLIVTQEFFFFK